MILSFECTFSRPQLSLMMCLFVPFELQSFGFYSKHLDKTHTTHFTTYTFYSLDLFSAKKSSSPSIKNLEP